MSLIRESFTALGLESHTGRAAVRTIHLTSDLWALLVRGESIWSGLALGSLTAETAANTELAICRIQLLTQTQLPFSLWRV